MCGAEANEESTAALEAVAVKRQKRVDADAARSAAAHALVHVQRRPLTLTELQVTPSDTVLNQKVLRLYCSAMGLPCYGSPNVMCDRLATALIAAQKMVFVADAE